MAEVVFLAQPNQKEEARREKKKGVQAFKSKK